MALGTTTATTPVATPTVTGPPAVTLLTPREVPSGSGSRCSGHLSPVVTTPSVSPSGNRLSVTSAGIDAERHVRGPWT